MGGIKWCSALDPVIAIPNVAPFADTDTAAFQTVGNIDFSVAVMSAMGDPFLVVHLIGHGNGLVYDAVKNITLAQDANLLGTLAASNPNPVDQIMGLFMIYRQSNVAKH